MGPLTIEFELDVTVKSKPVLGVDNLLLLLNYHWAHNTATFPTERHRVQFALILLILFATGCRPAELIDAKKRARDTSNDDGDSSGENDDDTFDIECNEDDFTAETDSSAQSGNTFDNGDALTEVESNIRHFDALCYEDVRLLLTLAACAKP